MKKEKALKIMAVISAVLSGSSVLLGCIVVIFPQSCRGLFFGDFTFEDWSLGSAMLFMLIEALFPLLLTALAVFGAVSGTMTFKKGIISAVLTVSYNIIKWLISHRMGTTSLQLCVHDGGTEMVALLSAVNSALSVIHYLNFLAVLLLISTASIEIYASVKSDNMKNLE